MAYLNNKFRISSVIPVTSTDVDVPDNIIVVDGNDLQSRVNAFDIISHDKAPNTVIMLGTNNDKTKQSISDLFAQPNQRDTTLIYDAITGSHTASIRGDGYNPPPPNSADMPSQEIYDLWHETLIGSDTDINEESRIALLSSRLLLWNSYSNSNQKIHIDPIFSKHDFRMIDCISGAGTLFFDHDDFEIKGQNVMQTALHTNAWAAPANSTILIREPSQDHPNASPCIHAHGIKDGSPEPRVLIRSDYTFS